jgi:hypothetical protein
MVATSRIPISIPVKACAVALAGPFDDGPGQPSLAPETRAALRLGVPSPLGVEFVDGDYSPDEALDLLDYFRSAGEMLAELKQEGAVECAKAYANIRHALLMRGLIDE